MRELELIDRYVKGRATPEEIDELWVEIICNPDLLELLKTEITLYWYFTTKNRESFEKASARLYTIKLNYLKVK